MGKARAKGGWQSAPPHGETLKRWYDCRDKALYWPDGRIVRIEIAADITERRQTDEALRKSEFRYRLLADNAIDIFFTVDMAGRLTYVSPSVTRLLGFTVEEAMARTAQQAYTTASFEKVMQVFTERMAIESVEHGETARTQRLELELFRKDGSTLPVEGNFSFLHDATGKVIGILAIVRDITDRKRIEADKEKLEATNQQLQKTESLSRMAGAIAHTFNNHLGVVIGNLELAIGNLPTGTGPVNNLAAAMRAANKAAKVSGQMLAYLGQSFEKRERLDLVELCRRNLPFLQASMPGTVVLETDLFSQSPAIMANLAELQQVLINLTTNGWEAIGADRGSLRLSVNAVSPADIPSAYRFPVNWQPQGNDYACLEVTDTGGGIAENDIEKLFDQFFSSKFMGRGMGLSMVLGIVKAHGGVVTVASELGQGSTFRVFLPVSCEEAPGMKDQALPAPQAKGSGTILLVEDEEMLRSMAAAMIEHLGYSVLEAKDGIEALDLFCQRRDEISLVISDLTMPGMDGWETLTAVRRLAPDIPVILASGYDKAHVMAGDHPELPQVFLQKPYRLQDLGDAISQALVGTIKNDIQ